MMTGFSNASIKAPRPSKPHICLRNKWWRVSPYRRFASDATEYAANGLNGTWAKAHLFVRRLNNQLHPENPK